jgi:large subunit ribosomal protein L23
MFFESSNALPLHPFSEKVIFFFLVIMIIDNFKSFVLTEKATRLIEKNNSYTLDVDLRLTKPQIREFIEELFSVKVIAVNTHRPPRKKRRLGASQGYKAQYKRAIVTLRKEDWINIYGLGETYQFKDLN